MELGFPLSTTWWHLYQCQLGLHQRIKKSLNQISCELQPSILSQCHLDRKVHLKDISENVSLFLWCYLFSKFVCMGSKWLQQDMLLFLNSDLVNLSLITSLVIASKLSFSRLRRNLSNWFTGVTIKSGNQKWSQAVRCAPHQRYEDIWTGQSESGSSSHKEIKQFG